MFLMKTDEREREREIVVYQPSQKINKQTRLRKKRDAERFYVEITFTLREILSWPRVSVDVVGRYIRRSALRVRRSRSFRYPRIAREDGSRPDEDPVLIPRVPIILYARVSWRGARCARTSYVNSRARATASDACGLVAPHPSSASRRR